MQTQWQYTTVTQSVGAGAVAHQPTRTGLNYAALPAVLELLKIEGADHLLERLQIMEITVMNWVKEETKKRV